MVMHTPMQRHLRPRCELLHLKRLGEGVSTDPAIMNVPALDGSMMAQVFYGMTSRRRWALEMRTESEFTDIYKDFLRQNGIPHTLRRDNAKSEKSVEVRKINREYLIADAWSEPYHPHQNPVELNGIKYLKSHAAVLMEQVGAPANLWLLCFEYICEVSNNMTDPNNDWKIPNEVAGQGTVDISHLLAFYFYQPVLYLDSDEKFPESTEKPGWFVGFSKNIGDHMTWKVLMEDKKTVLVRSVVRPAKDAHRRNRLVQFDSTTDEDLKKLDGGTVEDEVTTAKKKKKDDSDYEAEEDGIAKRTRSKTDESGPSSKTRSKDVVAAMVAQSLSTKFFSTFQIRHLQTTTEMGDDKVDDIRESLYASERRAYNTRISYLNSQNMKKVQ